MAPLVGIWSFVLFFQKQVFGKYMKFIRTDYHLRKTYNLNSRMEPKKDFIYDNSNKMSQYKKLIAFMKG